MSRSLALPTTGLKPTAPDDGPPLRLHGVLGADAFGYAPRLARSLHAQRLSLLHAHGLWMYPSLASFRWSRGERRPYLVAPHGMLDPWAVGRAAWKKRLVAWWFENAHLAGAACLHALTEAEAHAIRACGLANPICVVPNGVDPPGDIEPVPPAWADIAGSDRRSFCSWAGCIRRRAWRTCSRPGATCARPRARATGCS
jgi:poly(glycerol-phosphate) alpha-glucosyltransferase